MLKKIQKEHKEWGKRNFGDSPSWQPLLGVQEEVGELSHAHLKEAQGIRGTENHEENAKDAIADIILYLIDYCNRRDFDIETILQETWDKVKQRDWKKNPEDAHVGLGDAQ